MFGNFRLFNLDSLFGIRFKSLFDESTIPKQLKKQWWNGSDEELKKVGEMEFRVNDYLN